MDSFFLECINIWKAYDGCPILQGCNLHLMPGEFLAITGKSGAGKSTLLNIFAGLVQPDQGHVLLNGIDLVHCNRNKLSEIRRRHTGFIFQDLNLLPMLTAEENILLPPLLDGHSKKDFEDTLSPLLERFGLTSLKDKYPDQLSGGERQRIAIARAFLPDFREDNTTSRIIFADEPTGNLDPENAKIFCETLRALQQTYRHAVILVTHSDTVASYANRILTLQNGKLTE